MGVVFIDWHGDL